MYEIIKSTAITVCLLKIVLPLTLIWNLHNENKNRILYLKHIFTNLQRMKDENLIKEIMKAKSVWKKPGFGHVIFPALFFFFRFNYT